MTSRIAASAIPDAPTRAARAVGVDAPVSAAVRGARRLVVTGDVARVVLLDVEPTVEPERVRVHPQEPLGVRVAGQLVEPLVLEVAQILLAHLRARLHLLEVEALAHAGLAQARADLEHRGGSVVAIVGTGSTDSTHDARFFSRGHRADPRRGDAASRTRGATSRRGTSAGRRPRARRARSARARGRGRRASADAGRAPPTRAAEAHVVVAERSTAEADRDDAEQERKRDREAGVEQLVRLRLPGRRDRDGHRRDGQDADEPGRPARALPAAPGAHCFL